MTIKLSDALPIAGGDAERLVGRLKAKNPRIIDAMMIASFVARVMQRLRDARRSARLKQGDVAQRSGMSQARISQFEALDTPLGPTVGALAQYARACGFDLQLRIVPAMAVTASDFKFDDELLRRVVEPVSLFPTSQEDAGSDYEGQVLDRQAQTGARASEGAYGERPRISDHILARPFVRSPSEGKAMAALLGKGKKTRDSTFSNKLDDEE